MEASVLARILSKSAQESAHFVRFSFLPLDLRKSLVSSLLSVSECRVWVQRTGKESVLSIHHVGSELRLVSFTASTFAHRGTSPAQKIHLSFTFSSEATLIYSNLFCKIRTG